MYLSIRTYHVDPNNVDEIDRLTQQGFIPIISKSPGFYAYYAVDAGNGTAVTISVFETQQQAQRSNRDAADWVAENLAPLIPEAPEIITGDVKVYEVV